MVPERLICPRCGNTVWFREWALRYTLQPFEVPEGGAYDEAERHCLDPGEETFPLTILCDAEPCRGLSLAGRTAVWRHPNLEAAEGLLAAAEALLAPTEGGGGEVVAQDPGGPGIPEGVPSGERESTEVSASHVPELRVAPPSRVEGRPRRQRLLVRRVRRRPP